VPSRLSEFTPRYNNSNLTSKPRARAETPAGADGYNMWYKPARELPSVVVLDGPVLRKTESLLF